MTYTNPYQTPKASLNKTLEQIEGIEDVAVGQKFLIYAILINFASMLLQAIIGPIAVLASIIAVIVAIIGTFKLASGLGMSLIAKILLLILMFIPLINLITLLILNSRATKQLRNAGYKVGLLGASKP